VAIATPILQPWSGTEPPDLLVIVGEASGDEHAARLIHDLKVRRPDVRVATLGGPKLQEAGAQLIFDLSAHGVVGLIEVF
jgi:lipid-A-disaccharide synthase